MTIMDIDMEDVMEKQSVINIGIIGHVSNGKSSIVRCITGVETQKYAKEKERNITIKLGYANAKIYKCEFCDGDTYVATASGVFSKKCELCNGDMKLVTHVSFIDAPGHIQFMSTMISGKCIMDTTILVESMTNISPAPQTLEHLSAIQLGNVPNAMICLNKCDLVDKQTAKKNIVTLTEVFKTTSASQLMIPVSATFGINIDVLCKHIASIPIPPRDLTKNLRMIIVRSFDVNSPGTNIVNLCGGVVGGSVTDGIIRIGDSIELKPGFVKKKDSPKKKEKLWTYRPLYAKVISIKSENNSLDFAISGGLIGVQLDIDPSLATNDGLVGNVLSHRGSNNDVYEDIGIKYIKRDSTQELKKDDIVSINVNANNTKGTVQKAFAEDNDLMVAIRLDKPISASPDDTVTICFNEKIYGHGTIIEGQKSDIF